MQLSIIPPLLDSSNSTIPPQEPCLCRPISSLSWPRYLYFSTAGNTSSSDRPITLSMHMPLPYEPTWEEVCLKLRPAVRASCQGPECDISLVKFCLHLAVLFFTLGFPVILWVLWVS